MPKMTKTVRNERGQTMTELAMVLPILVVLILGIAQFGIAFNNYVTLTDAARAAARKGAVSRNSSSPTSDCQNAGYARRSGDASDRGCRPTCAHARRHGPPRRRTSQEAHGLLCAWPQRRRASGMLPTERSRHLSTTMTWSASG